MPEYAVRKQCLPFSVFAFSCIFVYSIFTVDSVAQQRLPINNGAPGNGMLLRCWPAGVESPFFRLSDF
jgi:hypothetical protein